jgi:hypothetical protein
VARVRGRDQAQLGKQPTGAGPHKGSASLPSDGDVCLEMPLRPRRQIGTEPLDAHLPGEPSSLQLVPSLAAGRHLSSDRDGAAGPGRRGRARDLGRFRRLRCRPGAPERRWGPQGRRRAEGAARPGAGRTRPWAGPAACSRPGSTRPPSRAETPRGHRHCGPAGRQPAVPHRGEDQRAPAARRAAPHQAGPRPGSQGIRIPRARGYLRNHGIRCTIPEEKDRVAGRKRKGSSGGRSWAFDEKVQAAARRRQARRPGICQPV